VSTEPGEVHLKHNAEIVCAPSVPTFVGAPVGGLGARQIPTPLQQEAEGVRARPVPALVGAPVRGIGAVQIPTPLQQDAEVVCADCTPPGISAPRGPFRRARCAGQVRHAEDGEHLGLSLGIVVNHAIP